MTVSVEVPYTRQVYSGPGDYDYLFKAYRDEDLVVTHTDDKGVVTNMVLGVDYTVTVASDNQGGTCHLTYAATDGSLEIRRDLPKEQQTDWVNNDPFNTELLETDLDRMMMVIQQLQVDVDEGKQKSTWRGEWENATLYMVGDNTTDPVTGNIYLCRVEHTSNTNGTIGDDIALGYWELTLDTALLKESEQNAVDAAAAAGQSAIDAGLHADRADAAADRAEQAIDPNRAVVGSGAITVSGSTGDIIVGFDKDSADVVRTLSGTGVDNSDPNNPVVNVPVQNGIVQVQQKVITTHIRLATKGQWIDIPEFSITLSPMAEHSVMNLYTQMFLKSHTGHYGGIKFQYMEDGGSWQDVPFLGVSPDNRSEAAFVFEQNCVNYAFRFDHIFDYDVTKNLTYKAQIYINTNDSRVCFNYNDGDSNNANYFVGASHFSVSEIMAMVGSPGQPVEGYEYYLVKRA
jgi:hypothetical protein